MSLLPLCAWTTTESLSDFMPATATTAPYKVRQSFSTLFFSPHSGDMDMTTSHETQVTEIMLASCLSQNHHQLCFQS